MATAAEPTLVTPDEARSYLVGHLGLARPEKAKGLDAAVAVLERLRCIQLDPLDVLGTNADLVVLARTNGLARGDVYRSVFRGHAFEHFAKERCLLPAHHFPWYRARATETPWWRSTERLKRVTKRMLDEVLEEVRERGPIGARELTQHGVVQPLDWNGWRGTAKATSMALEILWARCDVVVCGRGPAGKIYDVPERAFPLHTETRNADDFERWALLERVAAAGLLSRNSGAHWSTLSSVRQGALPQKLIEEGSLVEVRLPDSPVRYLASADFRTTKFPRPDERLRILGPLDPLLWNRALIHQAFGFEYVWEVYKPAEQRRWGWYVCPLLHRGQLVGRIEARVEKDVLRVDKVWKERRRPLDETALEEALAIHAKACGAESVKLPKRRLWSTK